MSPAGDQPQELYICHRATLLTSAIDVERASPGHLPGVEAITAHPAILRDARHAVETPGSEAEAYVLTCFGQVKNLPNCSNSKYGWRIF